MVHFCSALLAQHPGALDNLFATNRIRMNHIFSGAIVNSVNSVWEGCLESLLVYWLTGGFPARMSVHSLDDIDSDLFRPNFPDGQVLRAIEVPYRNPHRLQRDFLLYQSGYPPRRGRFFVSNGTLGNVAVIRRPPANNQPVAGPCLIWRGTLSSGGEGSEGGYAQYNGKLLHGITTAPLLLITYVPYHHAVLPNGLAFQDPPGPSQSPWPSRCIFVHHQVSQLPVQFRRDSAMQHSNIRRRSLLHGLYPLTITRSPLHHCS